jgi:ABC-type dipeptide/oligopeptide/nickel transport system permease subunit
LDRISKIISKTENLEVKGLTTTTEVIRQEGKVSKLPLTIYKFQKNKRAVFGLIVVIIIFLIAIFANVVSPNDPLGRDIPTSERLERIGEGPSLEHVLGLDDIGRDVLSRIIFGCRISITIGLVSVSIALTIGVIIGSIAGYFGKWIDHLLMRAIDVMMAFPAFLLALMIITILGPSLENAMIAVGIALIPMYARLTRGQVLTIKENDYVEAARMVGARDWRIIVFHILPNAAAPLIVQVTLNFASAILSAAALGFLGLGAQPPTPEWGVMLSGARKYLYVFPHLSVFPGIAIMITVLAFNLVGDGLRDAFDPRMVAE